MSQAEMDAALDALEADNGVEFESLAEEVIDNPPQEEFVEEVIEEGEILEEKEEEISPPGFMGYEEWIAKGKDPKQYRGEDAYKAEYNRIQDNKEMKAQLDGLGETMRQVVDSTGEWKQQQEAKIRAEYESNLDQAREESDVDKAIEAQNKLNELDNKPKTQPAQPQVNPLIANFRKSNPLSDHNSPRFNPDYNADLENIYNGLVDKVSRNGQLEMSDAQISRCLNLAKRDTNSLHPDLFESPRNNRKTAPKGARKAASPRGTDYRARLQDHNSAGRNKADNSAATDIYDLILNKKGGGKAAADAYAKTIVGE